MHRLLCRVAHRLIVALILLCLAGPAAAQNLGLQVISADESSADVTIHNPFAFDVRVVNVRLDYPQPDGTRVFLYSEPGLDEQIPATRSWSGTVRFANPDGRDLTASAGSSVAGGVDIEALEGPAREAITRGNLPTIAAQLEIVRPRVAPVSRSARFHSDALARMSVDNDQWFNRERIDGLVTALEDALCNGAGQRILNASGQSSRSTAYQEMGTLLREAGLHINCIPSDAKLAAARMLIASNRPQDALVIREMGDDGQPTEEWRPIVIAANLAFARTTAALEATVFSSLKPALEALNEVRRLDPTNPQLAEVAGLLLPRIARWIETACEPLTRDLENARDLIGLLRPAWDDFDDVRRASGVFATALVESGLTYCRRREYINSRNEFVRGERILDGIEEWENSRDAINRCRALGSLAEGREEANHPTDPAGPTRGLARLQEALSRFPLEQTEVDAFKADVASAYVAVALRHSAAGDAGLGASALRTAEETSPTGRTDAMRDAWLTLAEGLVERGGFLMGRPSITQATEALELADSYAPERAAALSSALSRADFINRWGFLLLALGIGLIAATGWWLGRRAPRTSIDDDL